MFDSRTTPGGVAARPGLRALVALSLALPVSFAAGCDDGALAPTDAGPPPIALDAGPVARPDAGPTPPPPGCRTNADCDDGNRCTDDVCDQGECWSGRIDACLECAADADCDDGWECSLARCVSGMCAAEWNPACECVTDADCQDGDPTTTDRCVGNRCQNEGRSCMADADCDDGDTCTTETCAGGRCAVTVDPGCASCPDRDGDGHRGRFCVSPGDDCNDMNPLISPSATEICDDMIDNDCDGRVDIVDSDCSTGTTTCAAAIPALTPGTTERGAIIVDPFVPPPTATCGGSNYYTLTLAAMSDVEITLTLDPPPPPTPIPGCPECTSGDFEYQYNLFLERTCGDPTSSVDGGGGCYIFGNLGFGGTGTRTLQLRRVPAGTYTVDIQASDFFMSGRAIAIPYGLDATVTPSAAPMCGAATALSEGVSVRADARTGSDAFGTDCSGRVSAADEAIHTFSLASRRRVRLEAAGVLDPASSVYPALQIGLYGACDAGASRLACQEHNGYDCHARTTLEQVLDPGTYYVVMEGHRFAAPVYDLTLTTEAVGAACAGAQVISASGAFSGDTTGAPDRFRDVEVCGEGYAGDRVYRVDLATDSRVVLDLVASYPNPLLTLYEGCGETRVAGGRGRSRIDATLTAGTYYLVAGGDEPTDEGPYVLNATVLPTAPPTAP